MERLARLAIAEGITFTTADFGGVRSEADTTRILGYREAEYAKYVAAKKAAGQTPVAIGVFRPIAQFGKSHHNYGAARDVRPLTYKGKVVATIGFPGVPAKIVDPAGFQAAHDRLDVLAEADPVLKGTLKIGDYFNDEPHFELRISLDDARKRYLAHVAVTSLTGTVVLMFLAVVLWRGFASWSGPVT
jgi:hypothetical protein